MRPFSEKELNNNYRSSWYGNYAYFISNTDSWFIHGGFYNITFVAGIFLRFKKEVIYDGEPCSFRVILAL